MRRILASDGFLLLVSAAALVIGVICSFNHENFAAFSRSGSVVVAASIAFLSRAAILGKDLRIHVGMASGFSSLDPRHYATVGEPVPDWLVQELRARRAVGVYGPLAGAIGTLVWGFGDLLNGPFDWGV